MWILWSYDVTCKFLVNELNTDLTEQYLEIQKV